MVPRLIRRKRGVVTMLLRRKEPYAANGPGCRTARCTTLGQNSMAKRVLRQEETANGHQQALGRHLGHRAGAE